MHLPTRLPPFTRLRSVRNAGTRIFAAGSDPLFGPGGTRREFHSGSARLRPSQPVGPAAPALFQRNWLDHLQTELTRYPD